MAKLKNTVVQGTVKIPAGNQSQRPSAARPGMIRQNTDTGDLEFFNGIQWASFSNKN